MWRTLGSWDLDSLIKAGDVFFVGVENCLKHPGSHCDSSWLKSQLFFYLRNHMVQTLFHYHWQFTKGMPVVMCNCVCMYMYIYIYVYLYLYLYLYLYTQYMQYRCMYSSNSNMAKRLWKLIVKFHPPHMPSKPPPSPPPKPEKPRRTTAVSAEAGTTSWIPENWMGSLPRIWWIGF